MWKICIVYFFLEVNGGVNGGVNSSGVVRLKGLGLEY